MAVKKAETRRKQQTVVNVGVTDFLYVLSNITDLFINR
jgi:hypothetical protein